MEKLMSPHFPVRRRNPCPTWPDAFQQKLHVRLCFSETLRSCRGFSLPDIPHTSPQGPIMSVIGEWLQVPDGTLLRGWHWMGSVSVLVCLRFALSCFQRLELEWQTKLRITFLCVKLIIHNRKGKENLRNNTLPILSEAPSTSISQAV